MNECAVTALVLSRSNYIISAPKLLPQMQPSSYSNRATVQLLQGNYTATSMKQNYERYFCKISVQQQLMHYNIHNNVASGHDLCYSYIFGNLMTNLNLSICSQSIFTQESVIVHHPLVLRINSEQHSLYPIVTISNMIFSFHFRSKLTKSQSIMIASHAKAQ